MGGSAWERLRCGARCGERSVRSVREIERATDHYERVMTRARSLALSFISCSPVDLIAALSFISLLALSFIACSLPTPVNFSCDVAVFVDGARHGC
jgi:hypothetical protein